MYGCEPSQINLLNARPERTRFEAQIIAQAGLPGAVSEAGRQPPLPAAMHAACTTSPAPGLVPLVLCLPPILLIPALPSLPCPACSIVPCLQVTVATNLAGRGTDILLGGNPKGLVQQLLENKLLPLLAHGED
jgi:hypothetical protein